MWHKMQAEFGGGPRIWFSLIAKEFLGYQAEGLGVPEMPVFDSDG